MTRSIRTILLGPSGVAPGATPDGAAARTASLVPLARADLMPEATGHGAVRLAELMRAGIDVPAGFVIVDALGARLDARPAEPIREVLDETERHELDALWASLGTTRAMVRGSVLDDAGDARPIHLAGSIPDVEREGLGDAVRAVRASLHAARDADRRDDDVPSAVGTVLVQAMLDVRFAGTLSTEHPTTTGAMRVEIAANGDARSAGVGAAVAEHAFGRLTGSPWARPGETPPGLDLSALLVLGREIETLLGRPQAIEWAFADGRFHVLGTRGIARSPFDGNTLAHLAERERARLIRELAGRRHRPRRDTPRTDPDAPLLVRDGLRALPARPTPFSADLMGRLHEADGATDIACRSLGVPYEVHRHSAPLITTVLGWSYVNREEEARRIGDGPGALTSLRLTRDADAMRLAHTRVFLPRHRQAVRERGRIPIDSLALGDAVALLGVWTMHFVTGTCVEVERARVAADFHAATARGKLAAAGLDPGQWLGDGAQDATARALDRLADAGAPAALVDEFLAVHGHRAPLDWEVAAPRYAEDPDLVTRQIRLREAAGHARRVDRPIDDLVGGKAPRVAVERARAFRKLEEETAHEALMELAQIRRLTLVIGRLAGLGSRVFQLRIDEVGRLGDPARATGIVALADRRLADSRAWDGVRPPMALSAAALERADFAAGRVLDEAPDACAADRAEPGIERHAERHARRASTVDRRRLKGELDDRRAATRATADGAPEPDRRAANRQANLAVYRGAAPTSPPAARDDRDAA